VPVAGVRPGTLSDLLGKTENFVVIDVLTNPETTGDIRVARESATFHGIAIKHIIPHTHDDRRETVTKISVQSTPGHPGEPRRESSVHCASCRYRSPRAYSVNHRRDVSPT
jgi:hypothetical protein